MPFSFYLFALNSIKSMISSVLPVHLSYMSMNDIKKISHIPKLFFTQTRMRRLAKYVEIVSFYEGKYHARSTGYMQVNWSSRHDYSC